MASALVKRIMLIVAAQGMAMNDKLKVRLTTRDWLLLGLIVAFVGLYIYAVIAGNGTLRAILVAISLPLWLLNIVNATREKVDHAQNKMQRLYQVANAGLGVGIWLALLNDIDFHIALPEWAKYVFVVLLLCAAVALLMFGTIQYMRQRRQVAQQKQLDQTKLQPLYSEQVKVDKVKEQ